MGFLFASRKISTPPALTGLEIQTAVNVMPIAIGYGTPRSQMNVIYYNGFRAVAQKPSGGKGLLTGGKGGETTGYKYFATFIAAICEGQVGALISIFDNQQTYTPTTMPKGKTGVFFDGSPTQTAWSYITSNWPTASPS